MARSALTLSQTYSKGGLRILFGPKPTHSQSSRAAEPTPALANHPRAANTHGWAGGLYAIDWFWKEGVISGEDSQEIAPGVLEEYF